METVIDQDLLDRGLTAQKNTVAAILEFASCMAELKELSGKHRFSPTALEWWGVGKIMCSRWLAIDELNKRLSPEMTLSLLPGSITGIALLATIPAKQFDKLLVDGEIHNQLTREDITGIKNRLKAPAPKSEPKKPTPKSEPKPEPKRPAPKSEPKPKPESEWLSDEELDAKLDAINKKHELKKLLKESGMTIEEAYEFIGITGDNLSVTEQTAKIILNGLKKVYHPDKGGSCEDFNKLTLVRKIILGE